MLLERALFPWKSRVPGLDIADWFTRAWTDRAGTDSASTLSPPLDLHETKDRLILEFELPGVKPGDVELTVHDGVLSLSAKRAASVHAESELCHAERAGGDFARRIALPVEVDADRITATLELGVLTVTLLKSVAATPRRIAVAAAGS